MSMRARFVTTLIMGYIFDLLIRKLCRQIECKQSEFKL